MFFKNIFYKNIKMFYIYGLTHLTLLRHGVYCKISG